MTRRRLLLIAPLLAGLFVGHRLPAQTFYVSRPNCHVLAPHTDNPFDNTHYFRQPALAWDAEYAGVSLLAGMALRRLGAPLWVAGALPTIGFGLVPHLIGFASGRYRIDVGHWTQVLWDRATPAAWALAQRDTARRAQRGMRNAAIWLAGETALSCFDR